MKSRISTFRFRRVFNCIVLLSLMLSAIFAGNLSVAHAEGAEPGTPPPAVTQTPTDTPPSPSIEAQTETPVPTATEAAASPMFSTYTPTTPDGKDLASSTLPNFKLPWDSLENGSIKWTSGPHSWSKGGELTARISSTRGSGLDFAKDGQSFTVLSMASGTVIKNKCGFIGLGCIVAIKHDVGGSVMIYAHLQPNTNSTAPRNNLQEGAEYPQHTVIGYAGPVGRTGSYPPSYRVS